MGPVGPQGAQGVPGTTGPTGPTGAAGSGDSAMFYAVMPGNNPFPVSAGGRVEFPQLGPNTGTDIVALNATAFTLNTAGTYRVTFSVPVEEAGQLVVVLNGNQVPSTVVGRDARFTPIAGSVLIHADAGDRLSINNQQFAFTPITVSVTPGGQPFATATLLIDLVKAD